MSRSYLPRKSLDRGEGHKRFSSTFSEDVVWVCSDGTVRHGLALTSYVLESGLQALGAKKYPTNVVASKDITIIESDFENPPDDPFHCPPADSVIVFYRDGRIHRAHQYYSARPEREDEEAN